MQQRLILSLTILLVLVSSFTVARAQSPFSVRINEILVKNSRVTNVFGRSSGMLELYNAGSLPANLGGCSLTDTISFIRAYEFPPDTMLAPGEYLVLPCDSSYTNVPGPAVQFNLPTSGTWLFFFDPNFVIIDQVYYGLQVQDRSLVRTFQGTWTLGMPSFGATNTPVPLGNPSALRINEWLANPLPNEEDYLELYNSASEHVALGGLVLSNTTSGLVQHTIAPLSFIGTGAQAYVVFEANGRQNIQGTNPVHWLNFKLRAEGTTVSIYNNEVIHRVTFGSQAENISEGFLPDGNTNNVARFPKINDYQTKSPGHANFLIVTNIFVNELLSHSSSPREDVVEFFNDTGTNANIGGWWLSNDKEQPKKYLIPPGTFVPPHSYLTLYEGTGIGIGFNSSSASAPFTFSARHDESVVLSQTDINGDLTGYQVYEEFEAAPDGVSFAHHKTSVPGDYKFVATTQTTFGADGASTVAGFRAGAGLTNAPPKIGPLVINEIMYAPSNSIYFIFTNGSSIPVFGPNPNEQFIELRNLSAQPLPLYDPAFPTNHWRLQNALSYVFPLTNLAPNSFCLIVAFDPWTNTVALNQFRARHQVPIDVPLFGPWAGTLDDNGDAVELYRPDTVVLPPDPEAGYVPYVRVDKVKYGAAYPGGQQWARTINGPSLQRRDSFVFGNDPANWAASRPTPGAPSPSAIVDSDFDGMPDEWEIRYGFNPTNSFDAALDADNDTSSNFGEFLAGSNPTNTLSVLRIIRVIPPARDLPTSEQAALVQFIAYSNATYRVEFRNKSDGEWKKLQDVPALGSERVVSVSDTSPPYIQRYYRLIAPVTN